jgi:hypothetical protein
MRRELPAQIPAWQKWVKALVAVAGFYPAILLILRFDKGELSALALMIDVVVLLFCIKIVRWFLVTALVSRKFANVFA